MNVIKTDWCSFTVIETEDDLKELSSRWKSLNLCDSDPSAYSQTAQEAAKTIVSSETNNANLIAEIRSQGKLPDIVVIDEHPVTIMLSKDEYNGYQWHISLAELSSIGIPMKLSDEIASKLLNGFFKEWKEIPNPGMILTIRHFVGND